MTELEHRNRPITRLRQIGVAFLLVGLVALLPMVTASEADAASGSRDCAQVSSSACTNLSRIQKGLHFDHGKTSFTACKARSTATGFNVYLNGSYLTTKHLGSSSCIRVDAPRDARNVGTFYFVPLQYQPESGLTIHGRASGAISYANRGVTDCRTAMHLGRPFNVTPWTISKYCPGN